MADATDLVQDCWSGSRPLGLGAPPSPTYIRSIVHACASPHAAGRRPAGQLRPRFPVSVPEADGWRMPLAKTSSPATTAVGAALLRRLYCRRRRRTGLSLPSRHSALADPRAWWIVQGPSGHDRPVRRPLPPPSRRPARHGRGRPLTVIGSPRFRVHPGLVAGRVATLSCSWPAPASSPASTWPAPVPRRTSGVNNRSPTAGAELAQEPGPVRPVDGRLQRRCACSSPGRLPRHHHLRPLRPAPRPACTPGETPVTTCRRPPCPPVPCVPSRS